MMKSRGVVNDGLFPSADKAGGAGAPEHKRVEHEKEHEKEHEEEHEKEHEKEHEEEQGEEFVERSKTGVGKQKHWSHGREPVHRRAYGQQEAPHHSKEVWKSPEEEELQMMAGRDTEEGSATKRTEVMWRVMGRDGEREGGRKKQREMGQEIKNYKR